MHFVLLWIVIEYKQYNYILHCTFYLYSFLIFVNHVHHLLTIHTWNVLFVMLVNITICIAFLKQDFLIVLNYYIFIAIFNWVHHHWFLLCWEKKIPMPKKIMSELCIFGMDSKSHTPDIHNINKRALYSTLRLFYYTIYINENKPMKMWREKKVISAKYCEWDVTCIRLLFLGLFVSSEGHQVARGSPSRLQTAKHLPIDSS